MQKLLPSLGLLLSIVACTSSSGPSGDAAQGVAPHHTLMAGCGMMIDGQMVYKNLKPGEECMNMIKPSSPMPNGVTMHYGP